ncbi:MAG: DUF3313 family protein [Pseudomonadales bacterium]|nr:DUF3313 family protein [Pseudomonadales bacterium]
MRPSLRLALLLPLLLLASCHADPPRIDTQARSFDGLYPVRNTGAVRAWARADLDLSGYRALLHESGGVRYAPVEHGPAARDRFPISPEARSRLASLMERSFRESVARVPGYAVAKAPGPEVLLVRTMLLDVASRIPPAGSGPDVVFLEELGAATLLVELVDSESGAVLVRALETRRVRDPSGLRRSVPARDRATVERAVQLWGEDLAAALERIHARFTIE